MSTGLGAVMNTCDVEEGATVAVFGLGAVGLAAVQVRCCVFFLSFVLPSVFFSSSHRVRVCVFHGIVMLSPLRFTTNTCGVCLQ